MTKVRIKATSFSDILLPKECLEKYGMQYITPQIEILRMLDGSVDFKFSFYSYIHYEQIDKRIVEENKEIYIDKETGQEVPLDRIYTEILGDYVELLMEQVVDLENLILFDKYVKSIFASFKYTILEVVPSKTENNIYEDTLEKIAQVLIARLIPQSENVLEKSFKVSNGKEVLVSKETFIVLLESFKDVQDLSNLEIKEAVLELVNICEELGLPSLLLKEESL